MISRERLLFSVATAAVRPLPVPVARRLGSGLGRAVARRRPDATRGLISNLAVVRPDATVEELIALAQDGFASYGRYWAETFRLPSLSAEAIDAGFDVEGFEHIQAARDAGRGPIMVLPHLGGWEWAAAWLDRVGGIPTTAVVERLEPPDLFEWFERHRRSYGVDVVPLGSDAAARVAAAIEARHVVCLLADRDLTGSGIPVSFFGRRTTFPGGPALLARRTSTVLLPTAVYFEGGRRVCRIRPPIEVGRDGRLRDDVATATQSIADALADMISAAPSQWHVLSPLWPATPDG